MSVPKKPAKVNLVLSFMYSDKEYYDKSIKALSKEYGNAIKKSELFDFSYTNFYEPEFGPELKKQYMMLGLVGMDELADIKHFCFELEMKYSFEGKRMINIDCGYVTKNSVVLASFKERAHRIYLDKGVYADLQLVKENKIWKSFRWTFPDIVHLKKLLH